MRIAPSKRALRFGSSEAASGEGPGGIVLGLGGAKW